MQFLLAMFLNLCLILLLSVVDVIIIIIRLLCCLLDVVMGANLDAIFYFTSMFAYVRVI